MLYAPPVAGLPTHQVSTTAGGDGTLQAKTAMVTISARRVGLLARQLVDGAAGNVLASVSGAIYLRREDGEVHWLAVGEWGQHRRAIEVDRPPPDVPQGAGYHTAMGELRIADAVMLDLAAAPLWEPLAMPGSDRAPHDSVSATVEHFRETLPTSQRPRGLATLVFSEGGLPVGDGPSDATDLAVLQRAGPAVRRLLDAAARRDPRKATEQADGLLGLGSGLTPSGDDFLGGFFFAWSHMHASHPDIIPPLVLEDFLARARRGTHAISYTILSDLAQGHGPGRLHTWLAAVLRAEPASLLIDHAARLAALGHTSGWDILAGATAAVATLARGPA